MSYGLTGSLTDTTINPGVCFVDREMYDTLFVADPMFSLEDIPLLLRMGQPHNSGKTHESVAKKLSTRTTDYLQYAHEAVSRVVLPYTGYPPKYSTDQQYMEELFEQRVCQATGKIKSFYEILPVSGDTIIVIMENGFLHHITQSKNAAQLFVLLCLGELDRFKADKTVLNKLYLNLAFIDNYHLLLKAKLG